MSSNQVKIASLITFLLIAIPPAFALPDFLSAYMSDAFKKSNSEGCGLCHMDPNGGGERNSFGEAFLNGGFNITPMMRAQFPDKFAYPTAKVGDMVVHFSDPQNKAIVIESGGKKIMVDLEKKTAQ